MVTGGTGFLGRVLCLRLLANGNRVRALCRRDDAELTAAGVEVVRGDLTDADAVAAACRDVDVVHHVAALAGVWGRYDDYHQTNVVGTEHVPAGCRAAGVTRLVYTSSPSVVFDGTDHCGADESLPYPPRFFTHYQRTKAAAEQLVLAAGQSGELRACALRPHLIWGPGDRHLIPRLLDRARRGRLRRVGGGQNLVGMCYVDNAAEAHIRAAAALESNPDISGRAYFITHPEPVNLWQWIDEILERAEAPPVTRRISAATAYRIGAVCEGIWKVLRLRGEPPMTRFVARQLSTSHHYSIAAAQRDLGFEIVVDKDEGMRRMLAALKSADPHRSQGQERPSGG
jgi:nucleoside-diphosphate-sugar epimerase